jgi:acyl-homoserine lactone synthase
MEMLMVIIGNGIDDALDARVFRAMFEERKRVFIDLLGWDIPVLAGRYEIDQFDDDEAVYIVVTDRAGEHCASARLLRTDRPHILDAIFPNLSAHEIPRGPAIREITRFCLARRLRASERRSVRDHLISALVDYALETGITTYTGVAEQAWFEQIMTFGWTCRALGSGVTGLNAMRIDIDAHTPDLLRTTGIYAGAPLVALDRAAA